MKPLTTPTPNRLAARAVFFSSSAARLLTPSGLPSPQTYGGRIALCRSSILSQTAWPTRWALIAWHCSSCVFEQVALAAAVAVVGLIDLEMIAPAGQLDAVVAELFGFAGHLLQRQIGPLTGEERDRTWHVRTFRESSGNQRLLIELWRDSPLWRVDARLQLSAIADWWLINDGRTWL